MASLGTARSKAADAAIQANVSGIRSSAEIYYADNGENYSAGNTGVTNDNDCFTFGVISLFTYPSIKSAMQQAFQQNGSITNSMFCGADKDTRSYAVAVGLKTQKNIPPGTKDYFCVDSTGTAKILMGLSLPITTPFNPPFNYKCN